MLHILPKGFRRSRFYGAFAGASRKENIKHCQELFVRELEELAAASADKEEEVFEKEACPKCGCCQFITLCDIRKQFERAPPISFHPYKERLHA